MSSEKQQIKIYEPVFSLKEKIGNTDIEHILTPRVIEGAQNVIESNSGRIYEKVCFEAKNVMKTAQQIKRSPTTLIDETMLLQYADHVKSYAGLCGYQLVTLIANSLYLFCEKYRNKTLTDLQVSIIEWHAESINLLLDQQIKETDSDLARSLRSQLKKIMETQ